MMTKKKETPFFELKGIAPALLKRQRGFKRLQVQTRALKEQGRAKPHTQKKHHFYMIVV
jgi:hypothetical protein